MSDDSEDSPPRPKRKIKRVTILSSSESESDDSVTAVGTRRGRMRVVSDEESDSSGSDVVRVRRGRALPKVRDSDSDVSPCGASSASRPAAARPASGFASDSSEGNSDKCAICLLRFTDQEVGTPQSCEHIFCLDCITEWSKNVNTCPVDRMTFDSIVVRACPGGRVLRTDAVHVVERRPSVDTLVVEDPTVCEICGSSGNEESMLLCDACDLGYHMQCLSPPLTEIPVDQWYCPNCVDLIDVIQDSEVEDLYSDVFVDMFIPMGTRPSALRQPRNVRRSSRRQAGAEGASTSSGGQSAGTSSNVTAPSTSRALQSQHTSSSRGTRRRRNTSTCPTRRRKYRRRKTVIIEYEENENGKVALKTIKKKVARRKVRKRRTRTAARRTLVRESVRARLAALPRPAARPRTAAPPALPRPALRLFGDPLQLDYFSDDALDEHAGSDPATAAVALRSTSALLSAHRQARRKAVRIPSPPVASSAPDLLSSIMESQTLLHAKNSIMSVRNDGKLEIKLRSSHRPKKSSPEPRTDTSDTRDTNSKVDLSKAENSARKVPSYPGHRSSGGGGGWGGGYRGNYHREQGHTGFGRAGYGDAGYTNNTHQNSNHNSNSNDRQGNSYRPADTWRDEPAPYGEYGRWPPRQPPAHHDPPSDRNRRYSDRAAPPRAPPPWRPFAPQHSAHPAHPSHPTHPLHHPAHPSRHSFGGFDDPLDMRTAPHVPDPPAAAAPHARPLPEPPAFKFDDRNEVDRSEDERSDPDLVIDTDKYDPTEPTHDDDSGDERDRHTHRAQPDLQPDLQPDNPLGEAETQDADVENEEQAEPEAGLDLDSVPSAVLDDAVRQVLAEHCGLLAAPQHSDDEDDDGDCPNFSIYSATSVHIASDAAAGVLPPEPRAAPPAPAPADDMRDLVQEDGGPSPEPPPPPPSIDVPLKKKTDEMYNEKVSKRCPITTDTRSPIKIKLNTSSLIKKRVTLYDEEEEDLVAADSEDQATTTESSPSRPVAEPVQAATETIKQTITTQECKEHIDSHTPAPASTSNTQRDDPQLSVKDDTNTATEPEPDIDASHATLEQVENTNDNKMDVESSPQENGDIPNSKVKIDNAEQSDEESSEEGDRSVSTSSPRRHRDRREHSPPDGELEKMTESISETEDERSYTPCLDENKSKDTSLETDKDRALDGLDTEMISEDEGNEMFSEEDKPKSSAAPSRSPDPPPPDRRAPSPLAEGKKDVKQETEGKKKKKKDSKKDVKERIKSKKKTDVEFKKLSKNGKERNYRERDKEGGRVRRDSGDSAEREKRKRKRKEKRKDLERYDVRNIVSEKRKKKKDQFGRDVSPRAHSPSPTPPPPRRSLSRRSPSPSRGRRTPSRGRRTESVPRRSPSRRLLSLSPAPAPRRKRSGSRRRRSPSPRLRRSPSPRIRRSPSPRLRRSPSARLRRSPSPRLRRSPSPRLRRSPSLRLRRSPSPVRPSLSPRPLSPRQRRRASPSRVKRNEPRRRRSTDRSRKRRRSASGSRSPRPKSTKRKKRARSERPASKRRSLRKKSPKRRRARNRSASRGPSPPPARESVSPAPPADPSPPSRAGSPRTPPAATRRHPARHRRHARDLSATASKEVFTSGDNILVSVSFKDQDRAVDEDKRERRRERRRRKRKTFVPEPETGARPVAIIDLERSPFRELTPSPRDVIVLSDSEPGERESAPPAEEPAAEPVGPKTPPSPSAGAEAPAAPPADEEARGPNTPPEPPDSPDAYDPYEPTRSASASPSPAPAASPPRPSITLEAAQKTNMSADEVLDRRPLSPIEKVMALLQSTRDVSPEPPPCDPPTAGDTTPGGPPAAPAPPPVVAAAPRIVLPEAPRSQPPKLFLAKPSPIKSDPIKPMPAAKIPRVPLGGGGGGGGTAPGSGTGVPPGGEDSPYSPGSSDFGELFSPPHRDVFDTVAERPRHKQRFNAAKVPVKLDRHKGKTQVGVKIDENSLKILDELPSSAVEMQVKSKFLKKLNRQERVVEEVKLVLKPHYNKKHITKDEYKDVLRRAVPKICHNKTGEINPTKIQALIEAYVKKIRKKHKLGLA